MSVPRKEAVTCPHCGKETDIIIWESLNADLNPKEKQQLLDGTLFRFTCDCGYTAGVDSALYDRIRLTDGRTASVVEIFGENTDFIVDVDCDGDWDTISVRAEDIAELLEMSE